MKTIITKKHEYLSGWTLYEMIWKSDYSELNKKNMTLQSVSVASKEPFSSKTLKEWAAKKGCDFDSIFTNFENCKEDCEKINKLIPDFEKEFGKNLDMLNSDNKCHIQYSATINPNYRPLETAFETILAYDVKVRIEFKTGVIEGVFLSQGRKESESCPMIMLSGKHMMESLYEEKEAIFKVESRIEKYVEDCDTDEKFKELSKILKKVQDDLKRFR